VQAQARLRPEIDAILLLPVKIGRLYRYVFVSSIHRLLDGSVSALMWKRLASSYVHSPLRSQSLAVAIVHLQAFPVWWWYSIALS
jgi:hypothetical protein